MAEKKKDQEETPMVRQYKAIKANYPDAILFFRLGDFYEMFFDDAIEASRVLDLTLTQRAGNPMCGVPYHACNAYLQKLLAQNYKVAICEQMTEPKSGKMVEREVVRVITPGTITEELMLDNTKNNYILCAYKNAGSLGLSYADITTGLFEVEFKEGEDLAQLFADVICRISPSEVIANDEAALLYENLSVTKLGAFPKVERYYDWAFRYERCDGNLKRQFMDNYLKVYELEDKKAAVISSGALIEYLNETQKRQIKSIKTLKLVRSSDYMQLDATARRNLELVETIRERKKHGSLLWLLDKTKTSMGARKFRYMFDHPLQSSQKINQRLDMVEQLYKNVVVRDSLTSLLSNIADIERLAGKIAYGNILPNELLSLSRSLKVLPEFKQVLGQLAVFENLNLAINSFENLCQLLDSAIDPSATRLLKDGGYIKKGFNAELDSLRNIKHDAEKWIKQIEEEEREKTGIKSLKIVSNKVYGYYIEVNKKESDRIPLNYRRKQTVANNERYVTDDLKLLENKIVGADEKAIKLEAIIYDQLKNHLQTMVADLMATADAISDVDALTSLATVARNLNFVRPTISADVQEISIIGGRHPVVEYFLKDGSFIANDTFLSAPDDRIMIITGPNMAGKSTYMRQVALITFMAHIGSFVPAKEAKIAITDRIFTRVGASDDLAFGQSTFMVEMSEVATILANATPKSLIVLDEIGRGTATFDGLSIAWAVVEHLSKNLPAKTLFATHYHELTALEGELAGVKNYKILVKELDEQVVFLRKIARGGANKSFGIEVARLAGLPDTILSRARQILKQLENFNQSLDIKLLEQQPTTKGDESKVMKQIYGIIKDVDPNRLSPMAALELIADLANKAKEEK